MIIKVCGMRDTRNIHDVAALDIDMIGLNFWPQSRRFVGEEEQRLCPMPERVKRVGLFVDDEPQRIASYASRYALDYVQLHGSETPDTLRLLRRMTLTQSRPRLGFIKAFGVATADDLRQTACYEGLADCFIFDYKSAGKGGSGKHFDWSVLNDYHGRTPFLLSGGIGPEDVEALRSFRHPMYAGVDVNSKFETAPAMKDVEKLRDFVAALKRNQQQDYE